MHIIRGQTRRFNEYEVFILEPKESQPKNLWQALYWDFIKKKRPTEQVETKVEGVAEANEETGLLIVHERDEFGNGLYTNGLDTIATDGPVKLLLLAPVFRTAFHQAGFQPKLAQSYRKLKIKYNGPIQVEVTQKLEQPKQEMVEA